MAIADHIVEAGDYQVILSLDGDGQPEQLYITSSELPGYLSESVDDGVVAWFNEIVEMCKIAYELGLRGCDGPIVKIIEEKVAEISKVLEDMYVLTG